MRCTRAIEKPLSAAKTGPLTTVDVEVSRKMRGRFYTEPHYARGSRHVRQWQRNHSVNVWVCGVQNLVFQTRLVRFSARPFFIFLAILAPELPWRILLNFISVHHIKSKARATKLLPHCWRRLTTGYGKSNVHIISADTSTTWGPYIHVRHRFWPYIQRRACIWHGIT